MTNTPLSELKPLKKLILTGKKLIMNALKTTCRIFLIALVAAVCVRCSDKPEDATDADARQNEPEAAEKKDNVKTVSLVGKRGLHSHTYVNAITPFENSYLTLPGGYTGPSFTLKHDYPASLPPQTTYPWKAVTNNGLITQANALAYVEALKAYVGPDMRKLIFDYDNWNDQTEPWWQSIWLGSQREPIHGMYVGSPFPAGTLSGQTEALTTYVFTLYDATSAVTLNKVWGTDLPGAKQPKLTNATETQYAEGSVIIKFAFETAAPTGFPAMEGAATWTVYTDVDPATGSPYKPARDPSMEELYLMQFDIIVKDSQAAPKTGWVFSTLVYDKDAPGGDAWDKMVPLGATWGDNPDVVSLEPDALNSPVTVNTALNENWINMNTPEYSRSTLGWDGRLSGPNDGAVVSPAITVSGTKHDGLATTGCFGCHSSAQYHLNSFLLPSPSPSGSPGAPTVKDGVLEIYDPGSTGWMKHFADRDGETPMDPGPGQIGLDYDMVTAFKAIPLWQEAMKTEKTKKKSD